MIIMWMFVVAGVCGLGVLTYFALRNRTSRTGLDGTISMIRSIDIEAFRNLLDPAEEAFLRSRLSRREFREIKRERARVALAYVRSAGRAAVLFARAAQTAQQSPDPRIAESGTRIAHSAFRLRLYTLQAGLRLVTETVIPSVSSGALSSLIDQYERTADTLLQLRQLGNKQQT